MSVSIKGTAYNPFPSTVTDGVPADGISYGVPGMPGGVPDASAPAFEELKVKIPTLAGFGTCRLYPFGPVMVTVPLVIVGTVSSVESQLATLRSALTQIDAYAVALQGGDAFSYCKLLPGSGKCIAKMQMGGKVVKVCVFEFEQVRPN